MSSFQSAATGSKMNNYGSGLLRGWGTNANKNSNSSSEQYKLTSTSTDSSIAMDAEHMNNLDDEEAALNVPKFQPGDHVIRWKVIKLMLWPIQIHGIVLDVDVKQDGSCSVVIADFGYSSNQSQSDGKKKGGGLRGINDLMKKYYMKKDSYGDGDGSGDKIPPGMSEAEREKDGNGLGNDTDTDAKENSDAEEDETETQDGKRFHLRTIVDPNDLKKWSKVNYGASIFSSKGKLEKLKKLFALPHKKLNSDDGKGRHQPLSKNGSGEEDGSSSVFDDDYFNTSTAGAGDASNGNGIDSSDTETVESSTTGVLLEADRMIDASKTKMTPLQQLIAQANEIDRRSRSNRSLLRKESSSLIQPPSSVPSTRRGKDFLKKFSLRNLKPGNSSTRDQYATISTDQSYDDDRQQDSEKEEPKLPKSDPRQIVLARTRFVLGEQDKSEDDSYLPPYHILYSNSECLAVWCKTGKFSTLQAAVFLHSTAVGNAKSTIMLTAGIAATQPWLIPVVGVYGIVAVGMPYYVLNKCKLKWKVGEQRLTNGFWESADNDTIVCAIENWSGLTPDKQENADEK
jgi:hypothetical protein